MGGSCGRSALYVDENFPRFPEKGDNIEWIRPHERFEKPVFIDEDGASRFDVCQHALGDCWFLSSVATLAYHQELFKVVVPINQSFDKSKGYTGKFSFYFWDFDTNWRQVDIDDRLPRKKGEEDWFYCYNEANKSECWPALLEKAYAKLRGCYENIVGGFAENALVDLTGGIGHMIVLDKPKPPRRLFEYLLTHAERNTLMSFATPEGVNTDLGIKGAHAYSVTGVIQIKVDRKIQRLVRLRDPHGSGEWSGAWSREPDNWNLFPDVIKDKFNEDFQNKENGEFWMPYEEVLKYFDQLSLCFLTLTPPIITPEGRTWRPWETLTLKGKFDPQAEDAKSGNYWNAARIISIKGPATQLHVINCITGGEEEFYEEGTFAVSLMRKMDQPDKSVALQFDIYKAKLDKPLPKVTALNYDDLLSLMRSVKTKEEGGREVSACLHEDRGTFVIVPQFGTATEYLLRIISGSKPTEGNQTN